MKKQTPQSIKEYMSIIGKRGGKKTTKKLGKEHYKKIARERWARDKKLKNSNEI